jgi:hypothetical protein
MWFVDEALCYASMITVYTISAKLEHYTSMVNLLGCPGCLQEAKNMIKVMLCKPDAVVWMAVLGPCRIHGNMEMQEYSAKQVDKLEPENSADFVLLTNMYATVARSHENVEWQTKFGAIQLLSVGILLHLFGIVHATCVHVHCKTLQLNIIHFQLKN